MRYTGDLGVRLGERLAARCGEARSDGATKSEILMV
jgi:hypothetical protein